MNGTRRSVVIVTIRSAVTSACFSFSIAQGPPMSASGWPPPMWSGPIWTVVVGGVVVALFRVAVPFLDDPRSDRARGKAPLAGQVRVEAEPHRPAFVGDRALLGQEVNDVVRGARVEFRGVGAGQAADVARVLDHRALHPEADPEVRDAPLPRVADRLDLALDPPVAEAAGHQDAVDVGEVGLRPLALDVLGVHPPDVHTRLARDPAVGERLDQALVRVLQIDVLAHDGDPRLDAR